MRQFITTLIIFIVLSTSAFAEDTTLSTDSTIVISVKEFLDYKNPIDNNYAKVEIHLQGSYINPVTTVVTYNFQEDGHTLIIYSDKDTQDKRIGFMRRTAILNIAIHPRTLRKHSEGLLYIKQDGKGKLSDNIRRIRQKHINNGNSIHVEKLVITYIK